MPNSASNDRSHPENLVIAHILSAGIVDFARLPAEQQQKLRAECADLFGEALQSTREGGAGEVLTTPTSDGMLLVYFRDLLAPVEGALHVARALKSRSYLRLRMGLHSGPVSRIVEGDPHSHVTGAGITIAQRVMDCGDAGHILLSAAIVSLLSPYRDWSNVLHDLGEQEIHPDLRMHLFNLHTPEAGNPAFPRCLHAPDEGASGGSGVQAFRRSGVQADPTDGGVQGFRRSGVQADPTAESEGLNARTPERLNARTPDAPLPRVALLCRRGAQPDEYVRRLLATRLADQGYRIISSEGELPIGVQWARENERHIRAADVVIPLLSAASLASEMLSYELHLALEAAQVQHGRPRLLPVRVAYADALPAPLDTTLASLPRLLWTSDQEDDRVVTEVLTALRNLPELDPDVVPELLTPPSGVLPLDSKFYIVRPSDDEFRAAIARRDSIVRIKGARQMGKTNLLARGLQQAREEGARVLVTDFQSLSAVHLESAESFFRALARWIATELELDVALDEVWDPLQGPNWNFRAFMLRQVLSPSAAPLVWGLDEVDRLFSSDFSGQVFALFRTWHNERALNPGLPWTRLTMAMAYATEAHLFIRDLNQSPFNVGTRIALQDLTTEQLADLNARYGAPLRDAGEIARFQRLVGGHPYLANRGLHEMVTRGLSLAALIEQAAGDDGVFGDHLRRLLTLLAADPELIGAVREVLRGAPCPNPQLFYGLWSAGLIAGDAARNARPRCELYATYLERHLS